MKKLGFVFMLVAMILLLNCVTVFAAESYSEGHATFEDINKDDVFFKQSRRGTCTLASSAMVIRRAAMLSGDENWESITEHSVGTAAWTEWVGISWNFSYAGFNMVHDYVNGIQDLKDLLETHPEGIVAYDRYTPHAIVLTDYDSETDTFYCSDPAENCPVGRVSADQAMISLSNVSAVWYISNNEGLVLAKEVQGQEAAFVKVPLLDIYTEPEAATLEDTWTE